MVCLVPSAKENMWFVIGGGAIVETMENEHWQCHKIRVRPLTPIHGQFRFYFKSILYCLYVFSAIASSGVKCFKCERLHSWFLVHLSWEQIVYLQCGRTFTIFSTNLNKKIMCMFVFPDVCVIMFFLFARHVLTVWLGFVCSIRFLLL